MRRGTAGILGLYWAIPTTLAISRRVACPRWLVSVATAIRRMSFVFQNWICFQHAFGEAPLVCNTRLWLITLKVKATNSEEDTTPAEYTKHAMKASRHSQCTTQQRRKSSCIHRALIGCSLVVFSRFLFSTKCKMGQWSYFGDMAQQQIRLTHWNRRKASRLKRRNTGES